MKLGLKPSSLVSAMEEHIRESDSNSMFSSTLGRVMNTLLSSRPRKLENAISGLASGSQGSSSGSLEEPLCFLRKYVRDATEKGESLDQILVPMIENSLKWKDSRHCNQVMILLNWLFQDELIFQALAASLVTIITRKDDRYIALGWCTLLRGLVDQEITMNLFSKSGIHGNYSSLLKILCPSIPHLSSVICSGSTLQDGFELPTRLSVAAADCILVLTEALTKKESTFEISGIGTTSTHRGTANQTVTLASTATGEKKGKSTSKFRQGSENLEMEFLLWDHLDELIVLVQKLLAWSRKSRPLHAKGLEQVLKWLQEIKVQYGPIKNEAGGNNLKTGVMLLSSCWKHYGILLRLEDHRICQRYMEMLNQYISGIQYYLNEYTDEHSGYKDGGIETSKFFLTCISLLLGRFDRKQFEIAMSEHGLQISRLLLPQLQCADENVIEVAVSILRATIFKTNYSLAGRGLHDTQQMEEVLPLLLNLLDERDSTARAVVMLTAEYCSINTDGQCIQEVFKRLASGNLLQRRNAIDVVSELNRISSDSGNTLPLSMRQCMAKHLLDRLGDEELVIRMQASNLISMIDPPLVLPQLVCLVCSPRERVRESASDALVGLLKSHNQNPEVVVLLLNCVSKFYHPNLPKSTGEEREGSKFDIDKLLRLIPEWSKSVQNWNIFIEPLVDKMFSEPSNAIIVRFMSSISEHLAKVPDVVLRRVLLYMQGQKEMDGKLLSSGTSGTYTTDDSNKLKDHLFDRLCPLLIIRLLPWRIFNNLNSSVIYGEPVNQDIIHDNRDSPVCITGLLVNRAFNKFEFEDVRKLSAELCGRIQPQVLFPIIRSQFEHAIHCRDIQKMKACLFSVCTSLVLRGSNMDLHPMMLEIRKMLEIVLSWPSLDDDEVSKAQHGCIDCLALMICAELQGPESSEDFTGNKKSIVVDNSSQGDASVRNSVLSYVLHKLAQDRREFVPLTELDDPSHGVGKFSDTGCSSEESIPLSFHLCMANVLISACQKISSSGKKSLAERTLPVLIRYTEVLADSEVRAACIQVLFSAVYHLKSAILPCSSNLLKLSVNVLQKGAEKEKVAAVKLMASLMASEDVIVESISGELLEARSVLSSISLMDHSSELRQVCEKLLVCLTSPLDNF